MGQTAQITKKSAIRIMANSKYNAHTEPLFKSLKFLKIKDISMYGACNSCANLQTIL